MIFRKFLVTSLLLYSISVQGGDVQEEIDLNEEETIAKRFDNMGVESQVVTGTFRLEQPRH